MSENSSQHIAAKKFAEIVSLRTKNQIKIQIYPYQQLGTDQQMIESARRGELAIIRPPTAKLSTLAPIVQILDIPFF